MSYSSGPVVFDFNICEGASSSSESRPAYSQLTIKSYRVTYYLSLYSDALVFAHTSVHHHLICFHVDFIALRFVHVAKLLEYRLESTFELLMVLLLLLDVVRVRSVDSN